MRIASAAAQGRVLTVLLARLSPRSPTVPTAPGTNYQHVRLRQPVPEGLRFVGSDDSSLNQWLDGFLGNGNTQLTLTSQQSGRIRAV